MIDTYKIAYPLDFKLRRIFNNYAEILQKVSPDGSVLWEKAYAQSNLPSSFSGLRVYIKEGKDDEKQGFKKGCSQIFFEFSLQKWQSETGYNEKNTDLWQDQQAFFEWVKKLSEAFNYEFDWMKFEQYRVDLSCNYILENGSIPDFLRSLEIKFSKHENGEKKLQRYDGALMYASRWMAKKLYYKYYEFEKNYHKEKADMYRLLSEGTSMEKIKELNGGKRLLTTEEVLKLQRMVRFEVEFRRMFLKRYGINKITDLLELKNRFDEEKKRFLTVKKINEGVILTPAEFQVIELCKRYTVTGAKVEFTKTRTERTWFRVKKQLVSKGIYIESILNADWRLDTESADNLKEFRLIVA